MLAKTKCVPGELSKALFDEEQRFIAPGIQTIALLAQLTIESGQGATVRDVDGNTYLDFNAGVSVASLGYSHPRYIAALKAQLDKITVGSFTSQVRLDLVKRIAELAPGKLRRTQFYSGGTEAVEAAIRLARSYTKKTEIFGFWGCFHGKTAGVLPLSSIDWKHDVGPLPSGMHLAPYPDPSPLSSPLWGEEVKETFLAPSRGRGEGEGAAGLLERCIAHLRAQIREEAKGRVAALIVEPIQGTAGNVIPPPGFLAAVREVAHENDALLIADEMITGFGRTGKMFGCDHDGVEPDIMTIGKGLGSGFPISALVSTDEIVSAKPFSKPSASSSSYGGNPLACAAALATLETLLDERLVENSARVGARLLTGLRRLQERFDFIGDVRGRGLLIGIDLVKDQATKEPLPKPLCEKLFQEALQRGLIFMGYTPRVRIHPPLILTEEQADHGVAILEESLEAIAPEVVSRQ